MRSFFYLVISIVILILFNACSKVSDEEIIAARKAVKEGALLIDVRTKKEYQEKHVEGAYNIPLQVLERVSMHLPKDKKIVVYCLTGSRSQYAAEFLREKGWIVHDVATQEDWEREIK